MERFLEGTVLSKFRECSAENRPCWVERVRERPVRRKLQLHRSGMVMVVVGPGLSRWRWWQCGEWIK